MKIDTWTAPGSGIEPAAVRLTWSAVEKNMDLEKSQSGLQPLALSAIQHLLQSGSLPEDLPQGLADDPQFLQIITQLKQIQEYAQALSDGKLDSDLNLKGPLASALQMLHASLRLNHEALYRQEMQLHQERRATRSLRLATEQARQQVEAATTTLQNRLQEIETLHAQLNEQVMRDPITGCFNRRYLEETLRREFSRAAREDYPLSLVMVDIDHFKQVNDTYGHPAGDAVLQALGILLRGQTRAGDIVCRYGGDEFLLVLPNMCPDDLLRRAEAWRAAFHEMEIYYGDLQLQATISIGIANTPQNGSEADELIRAVDKALYRAKHAGRDCVMPPE